MCLTVLRVILQCSWEEEHCSISACGPLRLSNSCLLHLDSPLHGWSPAKGSQVSTSTFPVSQAPGSHIPHCLLDKASLNEKIIPLKLFQVRIPIILNAFYIHEAHTQFFASFTCFQYMFNKWWSDFSHRSNIGIPSAWNTRQKEADSSTDSTQNGA